MEKYFERKNLIFLAVAKYLSGFASYIYDVGIVIYLFSNTQSVGVVGGFFCHSSFRQLLFYLQEK